MLNRPNRRRLGTLLWLPLALAGCYQPEPLPRLVRPDEPAVLDEGYWVAGHSVQGRPIVVQLLGSGPETVLLIASIHGNEPAGTPLLRRLIDHLKAYPETLDGRRVVAVAVANPDGWHAGQRGNARGIDLNRNFVTANRTNGSTHGDFGLSEPEAVALRDVIERYGPARIITFHQPLECIDYDGPAAGLAWKMAQHAPLPVKKLGARSGSLGAYAGETLGIPIITFEMRAADSGLDAEALWRRYGQALLAGIQG